MLNVTSTPPDWQGVEAGPILVHDELWVAWVGLD
jgi:hypothetical protein